ncbi:Spy/CpxP family protein refolding chaperone [Pseudomonadota bacterium]
MNTTTVRTAVLGIPLLLLSLGAAVTAQAESNYPMMGRGDHRGMMAYEYDHGSRMAEEGGKYGHMPCGGWGPGMMGDGPMGRGMMRGGHMGQGMMGGMGAIMQLDLDDAQEQKVRKIHSRLRRENWARMGDMMEHQDKLAELHAADVPDAKAIGKVYAAIFDLKRQGIEGAINAQNEVRSLLTEEQRQALKAELKKSRRYRRGYGYMR